MAACLNLAPWIPMRKRCAPCAHPIGDPCGRAREIEGSLPSLPWFRQILKIFNGFVDYCNVLPCLAIQWIRCIFWHLGLCCNRFLNLAAERSKSLFLCTAQSWSFCNSSPVMKRPNRFNHYEGIVSIVECGMWAARRVHQNFHCTTSEVRPC